MRLLNGLAGFWRGEVPLQDAFWIWAIAVGLLVNIATSALFYGFLLADWLWIAFATGYGISIPYNLVATVCVWRSADRFEGDKSWAEAAKLITAVIMVVFTLT